MDQSSVVTPHPVWEWSVRAGRCKLVLDLSGHGCFSAAGQSGFKLVSGLQKRTFLKVRLEAAAGFFRSRLRR